MTALGGFWHWNAGPEPGPACRRILAAQHIYGGDGDAVCDLGAIAIGRSLREKTPEDRLDLATVSGGGGRWHMVGSIRIDNRAEIATALGIDHPALSMLSDTHLAMRAWERWQEDSLPRLYGDYALAVWDAQAGHLLLARDPLGGFPLHYHAGAGFFAFASMPKGLHALPEIPRGPDEQRLAEDLALLPHAGSRSFFSGIERVEPAHLVTIERGRIRSRRHWDPQPSSRTRWQFDDAVEAVRAELDRAVAVRLRGAGTTVGAYLSGGLDSAAVAATAARSFDGAVVAFTGVPRPGFDGAAPARRVNDEGDLAALTAAAHPTIEHIRVSAPPGAITTDWDRDTDLLDQPVINPCNARWMNAIRAAARERGITVLLTGQAGNTTLTYHGLPALAELAATGRWLTLAREGNALVRSGAMRRMGVVAAAVGPWMPAWLWRVANGRRHGAAPDRSASSVLNPERAARMDLASLYRAAGIDPDHLPTGDAFTTRLQSLRYGDRGNKRMAALGGFGLDERDPTADRRFVELCLALPTDLYLRNGEQRALGKTALRDRVPGAVLDERRRGYQAADWHEGLTAARGGMQRDLRLAEHDPMVAGLLDLPLLDRLLADFPETGWGSSTVIAQYRYALLRAAAAARFVQRASDAGYTATG